uniref:Coiled-coil domain containing 66 n=1 Tax=Pelusios castaneus TaxID=367368 RepID=A0A8C8RMP5_9SAUR
MNLGDGLKLETEILDGKPRLVLASSVGKSKSTMKLDNKAKILKHSVKTKQSGDVLKSTQNTCVKHEHILAKSRSGSSWSAIKGEKTHATLLSTKDSSKESLNKDHALIIQKDNTTGMPYLQKPNKIAVKFKQKSQKPHISTEDLRNSLVCLTQEQLQQILMTVKQGTKTESWTQEEKQEETSQINSDITAANLAPQEENIMGLLQKAGDVSSVSNENKYDSSMKQASEQAGQKVTKNSWKPADMFSTLGEREGDKIMLEAKKSQWKKELDEQIALKKKLKETLEQQTKYYQTEKMDGDHGKGHLEKLQTASQAKAKEHERWAMDFDSLKNHASSNQHHPINGTYTKQPEILGLSPESQALTAFIHPFTPTALGHIIHSKVDNVEKTVENSTLEQNQKPSFLRSMTALLDPAQIEERDRRRQKQLEHQKAIMAQVEEKRRKKQLEEEQRKWEEQEEEHRLARERELMQKQFEEDMLKQKRKEEIMTLKTNELYQAMQRAQEQAQRLKQEQRIRELAQKGHDISKLQKNLGGGGGGDNIYESYNTGLSNVSHDDCSGEVSSKMHQEVKIVTSPRKDTAVQTDYFDTRAYINSETCTEPVVERSVDCTSPDISIEYKEKFNTKKCKKEMQYTDKKKISEKENNGNYTDLYDQFARKEKQTKPMEKYGMRPDWNINKPGKRYIPASERYPRQLQKQREEKKVRRQIELLQLVERNTPGKLCQKKGISPERSPSPHQESNTKSKGHAVTKEEQSQSHLNEERSESPPVPAVKNKLYQVQQRQINTSNLPIQNGNSGKEKNINSDMQQKKSSPVIEPERPPSSHFIPYVRTNEIYYLDPDAPMTRPSTHDPQYRQFNDSYHTPRQIFSSDHVRDPLLNPNVVKNRDRQQAILKGLSELRQGLLQKQKELETGLIPAISHEENFISPF